jgi:tRNA threonylcarbamoyladenosine biosynthesis protein TsaE
VATGRGASSAARITLTRCCVCDATVHDFAPTPQATNRRLNPVHPAPRDAGPPIHHFDLYRLEPGSDMGRLDMGASFSNAVSLVEWPERLAASHVPRQRLEVTIEIVSEVSSSRSCVLGGVGGCEI